MAYTINCQLFLGGIHCYNQVVESSRYGVCHGNIILVYKRVFIRILLQIHL